MQSTKYMQERIRNFIEDKRHYLPVITAFAVIGLTFENPKLPENVKIASLLTLPLSLYTSDLIKKEKGERSKLATREENPEIQVGSESPEVSLDNIIEELKQLKIGGFVTTVKKLPDGYESKYTIFKSYHDQYLLYNDPDDREPNLINIGVEKYNSTNITLDQIADYFG